LLTLAVGAPAQAEVQPGVWAFLYSDQAAPVGTYEPGNQAGAKGSVTKYADGRYRVELDGVGAPGVPMVTAVGGDGVHCQLASFGSNGAVLVDCYAGTVPRDSRFVLTFFSPSTGDLANSAYGFAFSGPQATSHPSGTTVTYNSASSVWTVRFTGAGFTNGGNVQVAAVGRLSARCAVISWEQATPGMTARVRCTNLSGSSRPQWTLVYTRERSIVGGASGYFGYVQADRPEWTPQAGDGDGTYEPDPSRNRGPNGFTHRVGRPGVGRYQVHVHGPLTNKVTLHVSANGDGFCTPTNLSFTSANPEWPGTVDVACFNQAGAPANLVFTLNYYSPS